MGTTPISTLGTQVLNRLEDPSSIFWSTPLEVYSAIEEALSNLLLLIGRPDLSVQQPFTLTANSVWQTIPKGQLLITDIQGPTGLMWKTSLQEMDYVQASWSSAWENDVAAYPLRWFPVGLSMFGVHPAPSTPTVVQLTTIAYPTTDLFPYSGTETVPFNDAIFQFIEEYAAHYLRLKEGTAEFQESLSLYDSYLKGAQRFSQIEDRRDSVIFSRALGGRTGLNPITKR